MRSPYLAQLRNEPKNRLPGTMDGTGTWDQRFSWNKTLPYSFVGNDFQSWKVYSVSIAGTGSFCMNCHRLGLSSIAGTYQSLGTAQVFGVEATAKDQIHKNPHSNDSPIWMTPGQITYNAANENNANAVKACAQAIASKGNNPSASDPPAGCQWVQYGQGNTCRGGAIRGVVNGATQSNPTSDRVDTILDLGGCPDGNCPPSFCYWRTVHGPFWQTSPSSVALADASYRGSFVRIYGEGGVWRSRAFSDPTGGTPKPPPGGTAECTVYNEILTVPDPSKCYANLFAVEDSDGTHLSQMVDATVSGSTANVLSGLIGNVAQASTGNQDVVRVYEEAGQVRLIQKHDGTPQTPLAIGPLKAESWTNGCQSWTAVYLAKDVFSTSDVQLVPASQAYQARCFITGVTGAWSSTRNGGTLQPFAEIYTGPTKDIRLRVGPDDSTGAVDRVGAYASCIQLN